MIDVYRVVVVVVVDASDIDNKRRNVFNYNK